MNLTTKQLNDFIDREKKGMLTDSESDLIRKYHLFFLDLKNPSRLPSELKEEYREKIYLLGIISGNTEEESKDYANLLIEESLDSFITHI